MTAVCATCVAQGGVYLGGAVGTLRLMAARAAAARAKTAQRETAEAEDVGAEGIEPSRFGLKVRCSAS